MISRNRGLSGLLALAFLLAVALISAAPRVRAVPLNPYYPTRFEAMRVVGTTAYIINDKNLDLVDVADPQDAQRIASIAICNNETSYALDVVGGYAYVLGIHCLDVIDVRNPAAPQRVSTMAFADAGNALVGFFSVADGLAYIPYAGSDTMAIIDVQNPAAPTLQGTVSVRPGTFLLHADDGRDALIWRAAITSQAPAAPAVQYAYRINTGSDPTGRYFSSLEVVDVQNPASPTVVGSLNDQQGREIWASAGRVYLPGATSLTVIDVSQPSAPQLLTKLHLDYFLDYFPNVRVLAGRAYLSSPDRLTILDVGSVALRLIGEYRSPLPARTATVDRYGATAMDVSSLAVDGAQAFAVDSGGGISRYDLTDPAHAILAARRLLGPPTGPVALVSPNQTIAVTQSGQILLLNERDLREIGRIHIDTYSYVYHIAAANGLIYALLGGDLGIFDASNPAAPTLRGSIAISLDTSVDQIAVANSMVYILSRDTLQIVDARDPAHPALAGKAIFNSIDITKGLALDGGLVYALGYTPGSRSAGLTTLQIIDVADPASPRSRGRLRFSLQDTLFNLAAANGVVSLSNSPLAAGPQGAPFVEYGSPPSYSISVADPDNPTVSQPNAGSAITIPYRSYDSTSVVSGSLVYSAGPSGLIIYDLNTADGPQMLGTTDGWPPAFRPADGGAVQPHELQVFGGYAAMINGNALLIVDVHDPAHPHPVGSYILKGSGFPSYTSGSFDAHLALADDRIYIVDSLTLEVVDVRNPAAPALLGKLQIGIPSEITTAIATNGSMVYLSVDNDLRIIDVSDPVAPRARVKLTLGRSSDISVDGDQLSLFGSESSSVLATIDVHDPDHPVIVTSISASPMLSGTRRINSGFAWATFDPTGYPWPLGQVIDIHNPNAISIIGTYVSCADECALPPPGPASGAQSQVTFISNAGEILRLALFPNLTSHYRRGGPGSVMSLQAYDLPPNQSLELRMNGVPAGAVPTGDGDVAMALGFGLDTTPGHYMLSLGPPGGPALTTTIIEISAAPLAIVRSGAASDAISLSAPAGLSPIMQLELPMVIR